jgi:hypothetical protein
MRLLACTNAVPIECNRRGAAPTDPQVALRISLPQLSRKDWATGEGRGGAGTGDRFNPTGC